MHFIKKKDDYEEEKVPYKHSDNNLNSVSDSESESHSLNNFQQP